MKYDFRGFHRAGNDSIISDTAFGKLEFPSDRLEV